MPPVRDVSSDSPSKAQVAGGDGPPILVDLSIEHNLVPPARAGGEPSTDPSASLMLADFSLTEATPGGASAAGAEGVEGRTTDEQRPKEVIVVHPNQDGAAIEGERESESVGSDGSKIRSGPRGVVVEYPDGRTETTAPDGSVRTEYPKEVQHPDGTTTTEFPYDGRRETTGYAEDDLRKKETEYPNGRKETEFKDGHKETQFEPNDPEGRTREHVSADGHVTTTKYRDGHTEQVDDRTGEVAKSYPPKNGKPGYTVRIGKDADGNTTVIHGPYEELRANKTPD